MLQFDWVNFINGLVQYGPAPPQITPADRIILTSTAYLNKLFPLLDKTASRFVSASVSMTCGSVPMSVSVHVPLCVAVCVCICVCVCLIISLRLCLTIFVSVYV